MSAAMHGLTVVGVLSSFTGCCFFFSFARLRQVISVFQNLFDIPLGPGALLFGSVLITS